MKATKSILKKSILYFVAFAMFLFASLGLISISSPRFYTDAASSGLTEVELDNPSFVPSGSQSSYPIDPSSYTLIYPNFEEVDREDVNAINIGTIKRDEDDFKNLYPVPNPNSTDEEYMLVIDSNYSANVGYIMSNAISMDADLNYMISVDVYTNASGIAELYLVDSDTNEKLSSILFAGRANSWTTYTFLIKTNDNSSSNIKLAMFHNGIGAVLFDNIVAYEFNDSMLSRVPSNATELDLNDQAVETFEMTNNSRHLYRTGVSNENSNYSYVSIDDESAFDGTNNFAFKAVNTNTTTSEYTTSDDFLSFEQNKVYKVTVKAKVVNLDGEITLSLIATDENGDIASDDLADENPEITISSNTSGEFTNGYSNFTFFIISSPSEISTYRLNVNFGGEDGATGTLYISTVSVSLTNYSTYSNASSSNTATADLSINVTIDRDNVNFLANGNFSSVQVEDSSIDYPITPSNWTVGTGRYTQAYGVVNTDSAEWEKFSSNVNYVALNNPNSPSGSPANNNILMMYNSTNDTLSYTSATKDIEKGSSARFTINIKTQHAPATLSLVSTINENEVVLTSITVDTDYEWKTVELKLNTAYQALSVSLRITLNTTNGYGYVYADNAGFNLPSGIVADYTTSVDLYNFFANSGDKTFATPTFVSGDSSNVVYGIVNTGSLNNNDVIASDDAEQRASFVSIGDKDVLAIRSTDSTYHTVNSTLGFDLTGGEYYAIKVKVFTYNHLTSEGDELDNVHASLSISGFTGAFENIITATLNSDNSISNAWREYVFYINPTSDVTASTIEFSLGSSSSECAGTVFFTDIVFDDTLENFDNVVENDYNMILEQSSSTDTDNEEDTTGDTNTEGSNSGLDSINWGYVLPTILFALAIVIAVVGVCLRKIKWKKPTKKSKNEYDRARTVSKQVYLRKATSIKEAKIRELNKQLETLTVQRNEYETNYKSDLNKLREMKIHREDKSNINKLEKEMKKNQRLASTIGVSITKVQNELSYVKSDAYMNNLIKKLATDKTNSQPKEDSAPESETDANKK